jgi:hypothetical protein
MDANKSIFNISILNLPALLHKTKIIKILTNSKKKSELAEIMTKYGSDKGSGLSQNFILYNIKPPNSVCHNYTFFYELLFEKYKNNSINIFEMGIGVPSCMGNLAGSLKGWAEYFPNSNIYSADIDTENLYRDDRITSYYVDQENQDSIIELWKNQDLSNISFDIIIDDGPHTYTSNYLFYKYSIQKLKQNGIYIIEDISLDFINQLQNDIIILNRNNNINMELIKLIIPYPSNFTHLTESILKMNNLLILKKL